ncbi:serine--tRNA ligase, partial [Candidatus Woesearchaeota archaeon]|nr:serine--tRNA ligase [Candidatus Woesearchaeota archaeon]
ATVTVTADMPGGEACFCFQGSDFSGKVREAQDLPDLIRAADARLDELKERIDYILMRLPNVLHDSVPAGKDETGNEEVRKWGVPRKFDFDLKVHGELLEERGLADFRRAAKISGSGFVFIKGDLVRLEMALINFAIDLLVRKGYTPISPPLMMGRKAYEGVTAIQDFESVMYKVEGEESYLIATSEHPMAAMYADEVVAENDLPIRLCGISSCFRREIGSHGVDSRGLFRMHQFNKVEQFVFCRPDESWRFFDEILGNAEEIFQKLNIPYRIISICTGDIGVVAAKKYDIEAWFPREEAYKEVVSCSNCTAYQAVGLNVKFKSKDGERDFVHTLNSTAVATSRALRAIIENYQNADGSITIPSALVPYMGGIRVIGKCQEAR